MLIPIIVAAIVIAVIVLCLACYRKAPPNIALVITGFGNKEPKVISGKGSVVIPILQRVDTISMRVMKIDVKTPSTGVKTSEGVPLFLDAVVTAQVYSNSSTVTQKELDESGLPSKEAFVKEKQQAAISNFLNIKEEDIANKINDILQGNLREIVATMTVNDLLTKRKEFAESVIANARPDLAKMGLEVVTFNIQDIQDAADSCGDKHGVVEAIGVQKEMEVKRDAEQARAKAEKEIAVARAEASREIAEKEAEAEKLKAEARQKLELRKAELKAQEDKAKADAEAAGKIQAQLQEKVRREAEADVEIAAQEKEILRSEKQAEVEQRRLDAEVRKKADAEKYQAEKVAEANKYAQIQKAEAEKEQLEREAEAKLIQAEKEAEAKKVAAEAQLIVAQKEAEAIRAKGEAEAEAIRAKGLAEAEAILKKAEAQAKMGEASKLEMMYNVLPEVARALASVLNGVDNVTLYGTDTASNLMSSMTQGLNQFMNSAKDGTGTPLDPEAVAGAMIGSNVIKKTK